MYKAAVIVSPRGKPEDALQLQTRSVQDAIDKLPPEGVLVKIRAAGVCHSDLHLWQGHYKVVIKFWYTRYSCLTMHDIILTNYLLSN